MVDEEEEKEEEERREEVTGRPEDVRKEER
jgi:hypothetical protein